MGLRAKIRSAAIEWQNRMAELQNLASARASRPVMAASRNWLGPDEWGLKV